MKRRAIVLLSGGLDSAVCLAMARKRGYDNIAFTVDYGQRHKRELASAHRLARKMGAVEHRVVKIKIDWSDSSLLAVSGRKPDTSGQGLKKTGMPSTYVPARNMILLSLAASLAESRGASAIYIGVNDVDFSGYVDCRPDFIRSMAQAINAGTDRKKKIKVVAPLLGKNKGDIIGLGVELKLDFGLTWSCYLGGSKPCGKCDSCRLRGKGFARAGVTDPLVQSPKSRVQSRNRRRR